MLPDRGFIAVAELAEEMGMDRSSTRRYILDLGYEFTYLKGGPRYGGQKIIAVRREDAKAILESRSVNDLTAAVPTPIIPLGGWFYIIQLVPDLDVNRVKLGFSNNLDHRLANYRTLSPTADVLKVYPAYPAWEPAAIASITRMGCKQLGPEVFQCDNLDDLVARADAFFAIMPQADTE